MPEDFTFDGFDSPNYTQVPDQLFDQLLARLSGAEIKVLLYIVRRTFGFKKNHDAISFTQITAGLRTKDGRQLDAGTGLSKSTAIHALNGLERKNIIKRVRERTTKGDYATTTYALNLRKHQVQKSNPPTGGWSEKTTTPSSENQTTVVRKSNLQETVLQEREDVNVNVQKLEDEDNGGQPHYRRTHHTESIADILKSTASRYQPGPLDPATDGDHQTPWEAHKREIVVADILKVTGDRHSRNFYRQLARTLPEGLISMALTDTRDAKAAGRIQKTAGAYFTDVVKQLAELRGIPLNSKPRPPP